MKQIQILIVNKSTNSLPMYANPGDSGLDVRADLKKTINEKIYIAPGKIQMIPTGLHVAIPEGYEIQVRSRSGLAAKNGLHVLNSPGTVDSGFRGEIHVILHNTTNTTYTVNHGDKIAQLVLCPVYQAKLIEVDTLPKSDRGEGGFGSTGN